jgi:hypothetical protein
MRTKGLSRAITFATLACLAGGCRGTERRTGTHAEGIGGGGSPSSGEPTQSELDGYPEGYPNPVAPGPRPVMECQVDDDCIWTPSNLTPSDATLVSARCAHLTSEYLPVCDCLIEGTNMDADGGAVTTYGGSLVPGNRPNGCSEHAASGCLYCENEFPGCDVSDPTSCDAMCADMVERLNANWRKPVEVTTRHAECVVEPNSHTCRLIYEVDGRCYTGPYGRWEPAPFDCNLPKEEALANYFDLPQQPSCAPRAKVPCTSSAECPRGLACTSGVCDDCNLNCAYTEGEEGQCPPPGGRCINGETCAMGTCIPNTNASCTSFTDCPGEQECLLSGITPTGRGNENTRAFCGSRD